MERSGAPTGGTARWRGTALLALMLAPLAYLLFVHPGPIPQDQSFHLFADGRTCLGLPNFGNVVSNLPFLIVGAMGALWYRGRPDARPSWMVFFVGVALVFFGSAYYHWAPDDASLVWDRLPMTAAFMGLFAALVGEHMGNRIERAVLLPAVVLGVASVFWWRWTDDLRVYVWVQFAPLVAIPFVLAVFSARYTHRRYLLYGLGFYALAKVAEVYDYGIYSLSANAVSGHSVKHLLAAVAPLCVLCMLRRRGPAPPPAGAQARATSTRQS